jgi:hypothetical protein
MDEGKLERLERDIEELKRAVKRNDPLLREVLTTRGWALLGLGGGLGITLFALPAHLLTAAYGSFAAIPTAWRMAIWAALILVIAGGGLWKFLLITRRSGEIDRESTLGEVMDSFFGAASIHVTGGMLVALGAAIGFSAWIGSPWYSVPASGVILGVWMNAIGAQTRAKEYLAAGWWSLLSGCAGLFFVEAAPFLWVLVIYGGMFYVFALVVALASRRALGRGRRGGGA